MKPSATKRNIREVERRRDPWVLTGDLAAQWDECQALRKRALDEWPCRIPVVDIDRLRTASRAEDIPAREATKHVQILNEMLRVTLMRGAKGGGPRRLDQDLQFSSDREGERARRFIEAVRNLEDERRAACVRYIPESDRQVSRHGLEVLGFNPRLRRVLRAARGKPLAWVELDDLAAVMAALLSYSGKHRPAAGETNVPPESRLFEACWCLRFAPEGAAPAQQVLPALFIGDGAPETAIERWYDAECYQAAATAYRHVQDDLEESWRREFPVTPDLNPVERWRMNPNDEAIRDKAEEFLSRVRGGRPLTPQRRSDAQTWQPPPGYLATRDIERDARLTHPKSGKTLSGSTIAGWKKAWAKNHALTVVDWDSVDNDAIAGWEDGAETLMVIRGPGGRNYYPETWLLHKWRQWAART